MAILDYKNYAFISYQRKDERWAKWLQRKLENFRLPSVYHGDNIDRKYIRPIFRDKTDLTGGVLSEVLKIELRQSRFLIVICSPNSATSKWVDEEIADFMEHHSIDAVIPFIIKGDPHSEDVLYECFPPSLRKLSRQAEILGIDIKEAGRTQAFIRLVAYMLGVRFDELWQRHKRRSIRIFITEAVSCLAIIGVGLALYHHYGNKMENMRVAKLINELSLKEYEPLYKRLLIANTICSKANIAYNPTLDYEIRQLLHCISDSAAIMFPFRIESFYPMCTKINTCGELLISGRGVYLLDNSFNGIECAKYKKQAITNAITGDLLNGIGNCCFGENVIFYIDECFLWQYAEGKSTLLIDLHDVIDECFSISDIEFDKYSSSILILGKHYLYLYDISRNRISERICLSSLNAAEECSSIESITSSDISIIYSAHGKKQGIINFNRDAKGYKITPSPTSLFHYSANHLLYAEGNEIKIDERVLCSCDSKILSFSIKDNLLATLQDDSTIMIWQINAYNRSEEIKCITNINGNGTIVIVNEELVALCQNSVTDCGIYYYIIVPPFSTNEVIRETKQYSLRYINPNSKQLFWLEEIQSDNNHNYRIRYPIRGNAGSLVAHERVGMISMFAYDSKGNMACFQNKDSMVVYHNGEYFTIHNIDSGIIDLCVDSQSGNTAVLSQKGIKIYGCNGEIIASRAIKQDTLGVAINLSGYPHKRRILKFDGQQCVYEESYDINNYREIFWSYPNNQAHENSSFANNIDSYYDFINNFLFVIYPDGTEVYFSNTNEPVLLRETSEVEPIAFGDYIAVASKGTISVFHFPSATCVDTIECEKNCIRLEYNCNEIIAYYDDGKVISYPFTSYEDNISTIRKLMGSWIREEATNTRFLF